MKHTDFLTRLTKGTDAGLYRLIPEEVIIVNNENDVKNILAQCEESGRTITFRAGGTSLSGQTVTNSILVEIGSGFNKGSVKLDGAFATFSCGVTGEQANRMLRPYGRKIGPAPASIKSARIGGIVGNNASGAGYGIAYNSYNTVRDMRIILADGNVLDTSDLESRQVFLKTHTSLLEKLMNFRMEILYCPEMLDKILHKYELKNTCGYSMNALVDYDDPYDMLLHLMVGSEGTLGFISEVTFETVPDLKLKASALLYFPDLREACKAILPLNSCQVSAAELMDHNALRAVENESGMPEILRTLPDEAVALLIDTSANDEKRLYAQFEEIENALSGINTLYPVSFTTDPILYAAYWRVRSGLFTSAAARRPKGTVSIIEDIAFREDVLADALTDVRELLTAYGYADAVMWGHLLDGNVHFTIFPDINKQEGVDQYADFMRKLVEVVLRYNGSLKAEHGTGRNMAPFVEQEWGEKIYALMWEIKRAFDPKKILNPGVILNADPEVFIKDLKQMPVANDLIDKCIECGFCEIQCPSRNLTLTPRQRIVAYRTLAAMTDRGEIYTRHYLKLKKAFKYSGKETCATDGLCGTACPVGINTGTLIKELRWKDNGWLSNTIAYIIAANMQGVTAILRPMLSLTHWVARTIGYDRMENIMNRLCRVTNHLLPIWTRYAPSGARSRSYVSENPGDGRPEMVYFPSCITRTMGPSPDYDEKVDVTEKTIALLHKAGFAVRYPKRIHNLCCGMAFSSKGFRRQAKKKEEQLNKALLAASDNGRLPILCDMSPCLLHMQETLDKRLKLHEPVEFIYQFMLDKLTFHPLPVTVAVHSTCSTIKMGVDGMLVELAGMCAKNVVSPAEVTCCGWAGDRGFFYPELTASALQSLRKELGGAKEGYSNSRTCEIGLTMHSDISYKSIVYLVDKATERR